MPAEDPEFLTKRVLSNTRYDWDREHILHGLAPGPNDLVLTSNDYLQIADDPSLVNAEIQALRMFGHGTPQSRVFSNHLLNHHREFEKRMAAFVGSEDAVLCQSGYDANLGLMESFGFQDVPVYVDMFAHASIWKGCESAGVKPFRIRHNSVRHLRSLVSEYGSGIVAIDAVYSQNGSLCNLREFADACSELNCALIVDETHSFGMQGDRGEGMTRSLGLHDAVHFQVIGLSKSFASRGGIVAGSRRNLNYFRDNSYPAIFSTQVMRHEVAGYSAALDLIQQYQDRRNHVHTMHGKLRRGIETIGFDTSDSQTQIVSLVTGLEKNTIVFRDYIERRGLFGSVYCYPATPKNRSLIRFTVNASLTNEQIDDALRILRSAFVDLSIGDWRFAKLAR